MLIVVTVRRNLHSFGDILEAGRGKVFNIDLRLFGVDGASDSPGIAFALDDRPRFGALKDQGQSVATLSSIDRLLESMIASVLISVGIL